MDNKTRRIVITGVLAALVCAGSAIRITMPIAVAGTTAFHLGNIMCSLAGILLGPACGGLAAGIGSAIYDMTNPLYISEAWMTFILKGIYGFAAGFAAKKLRKSSHRYLCDTISASSGAAAYIVLYFFKTYFYSGRLIHGLTPDAAMLLVAGKVPATLFNAVIAIVCAPLLASALRKALKKEL